MAFFAPDGKFDIRFASMNEKKIISNENTHKILLTKVLILTSNDGFQEASKRIARLAPVKLIPKAPALVEIKKSLKSQTC